MTESTCTGTKTSGERCASTIGLCPECGACLQHCEHRQDVARAGRAKGGKVMADRKASRVQVKYAPARRADAPEKPTNVVEAQAYLAWLLDQATTGGMGSQAAKDAATICKLFIDATKVADHEGRLKRLEEAQKNRRADGR